MELVVVGSVGLDDVETPHGRVERVLGGAASYFALASSFVAQTGFVGIVGTDFPVAYRSLFGAHGVDLRGLEQVHGETFRWSGRYSRDMNDRDTLFVALNVFERFRPSLPADYRATRTLFLANIDPELQLHVLEQVESPSFVAMDTMNFWIAGKPEALRAVMRRVDGITLNDAEARELTGESNIIRAARAVSAMGPRVVVIKRGEYGAMLYSEGRMFYAPAFPLTDVVDPTGAGDSFAGGFMGYLARRGELSWPTMCQAVIVGSTMASFCVERFSVERLQSLTSADVQERVRQFHELTRFSPLEDVAMPTPSAPPRGTP